MPRFLRIVRLLGFVRTLRIARIQVGGSFLELLGFLGLSRIPGTLSMFRTSIILSILQCLTSLNMFGLLRSCLAS